MKLNITICILFECVVVVVVRGLEILNKHDQRRSNNFRFGLFIYYYIYDWVQ